MSHARVSAFVLALVGVVSAQQPTNDFPNPYQTVADYFKLPAGRT